MSDLDEKRNDIPLNQGDNDTNWLDDLSGYIESGAKIFNEGISILDTLGIVDNNDVNNIKNQVSQKSNEVSTWMGNQMQSQMLTGMIPFIIIGGIILLLVFKK